MIKKSCVKNTIKGIQGNEPSDWDGEVYEGKENITYLDEKGSVVLVVLRKAIPKPICKEYWASLGDPKTPWEVPNGRFSASGVHKSDVKKLEKSGSAVKTGYLRQKGWLNLVGGFVARAGRNNYCRPSAFTANHPDIWKGLLSYFSYSDGLYKKYAPNEYAQHEEFARKTQKDFMIGDTVFTSITFNKNFQTHYHTDKGNLKVGLGVMGCLVKGFVQGGDFILPEYGIGCSVENRDLLLVDNNQFHGNTKIRGSRGHQRITTVMYYKENMIFCGPREVERQRTFSSVDGVSTGSLSTNLNPNYSP